MDNLLRPSVGVRTVADMEMTLTVHTPRRRPRPVDVIVRWSGAHEAADLCTALAAHLRVPVPFLTSHGRPVPATTRVGVPPLVHGAAVAVGSGSPLGLVGTGPPGTALELVVVGGPDAGHARALVPPGVQVGRGVASGLNLADDALSRVHALVRVGPTGIAVEDMGSTNGIRVDGRPVIGSTAVDTSSTITLGSSTVRVRRSAGAGIPLAVLGDGTIVVRPTSDEVPSSGPVEVECPAAPIERARARIPWVGALVPVPIGLALAWFLGPQLLLFSLLGPVALLANAAVDRWGAGRTRRRDGAAHATALQAARDSLERALRTDVARLERVHPDPHEVLRTAEHRLPGMWRARKLEVRLGMGDVPTRVVWIEGTDRTHPRVGHGPVVLDLEQVGLLGVVGPPAVTSRVLGNIVGQLCTRHGPGRLSVTIGSDDPAWGWVLRLPHAAPRGAAAAAGRPGPPVPSRSDAEQSRAATIGERGGGPAPGKQAVRRLLVVPDAGAVISACIGTAAEERSSGAVVVVAAPDREALPHGCGGVLSDAGNGRHVLEVDGIRLTFVLDLVGPWWSERVSRALAPLRTEAGGTGADLAAEVRLPVVLGLDHVTPADVLERWGIVPSGGSATSGRPPVAVVGVSREGPHRIDLRRDGPHVLVGGTTGSGKSELLRTLVASLALACPPADLTFVLVDFKGGAAFGACAELPHVVGLVTDLDEHLVARALTSLGAEIRRRERLLAAAGVTEIDAYARSTTPRSEPVPRLVVVIDELRALVDDVPDFVRGLVRLAALGRSLGIHLVLATQRPSGAVTAEVQANVNLRIALRMRDRSDSVDVIDDGAAASIPTTVPGRAIARGGDGSLTAFQTAVVASSPGGGRRFLTVATCESAPDADGVDGENPDAGSRARQDGQPAAREGSALVDAIIEAHRRTGAPDPRAPWLPPLPEHIPALVDGLEGVTVGLVDEPELQRTSPLVWRTTDGNWLLSGRPRSGRTSALRAVVLGAAAAHPPDRLHVHVIDASGSLADLTRLPHVGTRVDAEDARTVTDLTSHLQDEVRQRRARLTGARSVEPPDRRDDPTILLVVDGWEQLLEAASDSARPAAVPGDDMLRVLRDGQGVGVVAVVSGGRSLLQSRWSGLGCETYLLGAVDPLEAALAGLRPADLATTPPPGRGVRLRDRRTVQFALATPKTTAAVAVTSRPAAADRSAFVVRALPSVVRRHRPDDAACRQGVDDDLHSWAREVQAPPTGEALPLGVSRRTPATWSWDARKVGRRLLIAGAEGSGRTNALRVLAESAAAAGRAVVVVRPINDGIDPEAFSCAVLGSSDAGALVMLRRRHPDLVVLVDDAHLLEGTSVLQPLLEIDELADRDGGLLAVTTSSHALVTRFRGLDIEIARHRTALLLSPRPTDGDAFGVRRLDGAPAIPGRGVFIHHGTTTEVQVFLCEEGSVRGIRAGEGSVVGRHGEGCEASHQRDGDDHPAEEGTLTLDEPDADRDQQEVPDDGGGAGPRRLPQPASAERAQACCADEDEQCRHEHARGVASLAGGELVDVERREPRENQRLRPGEECGEAPGAA